jgi:tetratricopeptide (TPR) repeat protein/transcriptional regulator with XRE-family HTH domain
MDGSFGALLRAHRRVAGLTQEALAVRAALSSQAVGALERGDRRFPHRDTVARLAVALGLDPGQQADFVAAAARQPAPRPEVVAQRQVVASDGGGPGPEPPRQLLAAPAHFAGRAAPAKAILDAVEHSTGVVVSAISGMAGIGKTAFALHCAHQLRDRYPDGQLYADLRGFEPYRPPVSSASVVRAFLEALQGPGRSIPADPEAQIGLYRSILADRRMLIVLDNALDAEQVRPLLPPAPGCLALVTSRHRLTSLAVTGDAQLITLDLLTHDDARDLLVARLGRERVSAEPLAADAIISRCGYLPLALAIVAARAAADPRFPLAALAEELDQGGCLDALHGGDATASVRIAFSCSYQTLSPLAARLFRLLGAHPGPDVSTYAAASLAGVPVQQVRAQLTELTHANLIAQHQPGRFALHDLVRAYATERAGCEESGDDLCAAIHRMFDHYLHSAHAANHTISSHNELTDLSEPQPGTVPERPCGSEEAVDWFTAERAVLPAVVDEAGARGYDVHVWQLAWSFTDFLCRRGDWQADIGLQLAALGAARRLRDAPAQARTHRLLASDLTQLGRYAEALDQLHEALRLTIATGDACGQAHTHNHLAFAWERQGRYDQTLHHCQQALALFQETGNRVGQADALNGIGWSHVKLGNHKQAKDCCRRAIALNEELGSKSGRASAWDSLGYAHHHLGEYEQAIACYERSIQLHRDLGNRYYEATVLTHLGDTHLVTGGRGGATKLWRQALDILVELDHADAGEVQAKLDGAAAAGGQVDA